MPDRRNPHEPAEGRPSPTADQLRSDIDSGRARDKVAYPDPAMAPLGTDDEAAGAPPTPEQVETARRHETRRDGPETADASRTAPHGSGSSWMVWLIGAVLVLAILTAVAFAV